MSNLCLSSIGVAGKVLRRLGTSLEKFALDRSPDTFAVFFEPDAVQINEARLRHLASLGLDLENKTVLEVGAGIGLLTEFFEKRGCIVLSTEGRPENVAEFRRRYPNRKVELLDLEPAADLIHLGMFDVIFCYGLLYHVSTPERVLASLSKICREVILLETCVTPGSETACYIEAEDKDNKNQAMSGHGCRPTRPWVMDILHSYFGYAYVTKTQPRYIDFDLDWVNPVSKKNHRAVFVGSKMPLDLPTLLDQPPDYQVFCGC
jgi:SAM-dependent methyltransferase